MSLKEAIELQFTLEYESSQWSGIAYHGNSINVEYEDAIDSFKSQFKDFGAVWFTKDERFAMEFSKKHYNEDAEDQVRVIFKCRVTLDNYVDIDYETYQDMITTANSDSLHNYIPALKKMGYDGWITEGDVNGQPFDDIAVFEPEKSIKPMMGKIHMDGQWSKWIPISDLEKVVYLSKFTEL